MFLLQIGFEDLNPESQQQILDLVEIYRCILNLENTEEHISDSQDTVRTSFTEPQPEKVEGLKNNCETVETKNNMLDHDESVNDADDEDEDDVVDPVDKELAISGCCVENIDFSVPDVIPNHDLRTRNLLPDLIPRSKLRTLNQRSLRPSRFQIQDWSREEGGGEEIRPPTDWRLYGRQLDLISSNFSLGRGPPDPRGPLEADDLDGGHDLVVRRGRSDRKFFTDFALSVVANTVVYLFLRKLKRLIF